MRFPHTSAPHIRSGLSTLLRAVAVCAGLACIAGVGGCKAKNTAAAPQQGFIDPTTVSADYIALYESKRYAEAKASAEYRIPKSSGREKEVAQLTAGLSAHALGRDDEAIAHLQPLTGSKDPKIAGRAEATLGQIAQSRGQHSYAADLFTRASGKLEGDDAARAGVRAGNSLSAIGKPTEANAQYKAAAAEAESDAIRKHANTLSEPGPFALQAGVFTTKANADKRAGEISKQSGKAGLGYARVVPDSLNGKPAFAVQVGKFANRQTANAAKGKLTVQTVVVQAE